jgi:hypothetical protein
MKKRAGTTSIDKSQSSKGEGDGQRTGGNVVVVPFHGNAANHRNEHEHVSAGEKERMKAKTISPRCTIPIDSINPRKGNRKVRFRGGTATAREQAPQRRTCVTPMEACDIIRIAPGDDANVRGWHRFRRRLVAL